MEDKGSARYPSVHTPNRLDCFKALSNRRSDWAPWIRLALVFTTLSCGPVLFSGRVRSAEQALQEAREVDSNLYAPYEYYSALEFLNEAQDEAALGNYEEAIEYASMAREFAKRSVERGRGSHFTPSVLSADGSD